MVRVSGVVLWQRKRVVQYLMVMSTIDNSKSLLRIPLIVYNAYFIWIPMLPQGLIRPFSFLLPRLLLILSSILCLFAIATIFKNYLSPLLHLI